MSNVGPGVGGVDHDAGGDDEADVVDAVGAATEEDEVARFDGRAGRQDGTGVVLVLGDAGQGDPGDFVGGLDKAGSCWGSGPTGF